MCLYGGAHIRSWPATDGGRPLRRRMSRLALILEQFSALQRDEPHMDAARLEGLQRPQRREMTDTFVSLFQLQ
jgi:hypothetical protein